MDVSICIVSFNRKELLADCISSVQSTTKRMHYEVIVVDNDSKDGTVDFLREQHPAVRVITNAENKGFGAANNQAIEVAKGRYCLLLNNDTIVLPNCIDTLVDFLDTHPDSAVAGCRMYNSREISGLHRTCYNKYPTIWNSFLHQIATLFKLPGRFPDSAITRRLQMGMSMTLHNQEQEPEHINGACMMCRTDVLRQVGGFDERYFLFLEETDLCVGYCPGCVAGSCLGTRPLASSAATMSTKRTCDGRSDQSRLTRQQRR